MDIQTEHLDNHTTRLTVELDPERLERAMRQAARRISKQARIPGFRPGKAPMNIVINMYGHGYVLNEALESLGNDVYREALVEADIQPYAPGSLEDIQDEGRTLVFTVPRFPTIELNDYREIRLPFEVDEITDEMVDAAMEELRQQKALVEDVDRPAQMDDQVMLLHIEVVDLTPDEAEDDEIAAEAAEADDEADAADGEDDDRHIIFHQHDLEHMLTDDEDDDLFPGFSEQIVGLSAGDDAVFTLDIPADYDFKDIAGRTIECEVTVGQVQSRTVPEWTDDLARKVGEQAGEDMLEIESLLDLRMDVRRWLEEDARNQAENELAIEALEELVERADISFPEEAIQENLDDIVREVKSNLSQQGLRLDDYLTIVGKTENDLRDEYRDNAIQRAERNLALGELIVAEKLDISEEDIEARIDELSTLLGGEEQAGQFRQYLAMPESRRNIANRLLTDRALERLTAIAKDEAPPLPADDDEEEDASGTADAAIDDATETEHDAASDDNAEAGDEAETQASVEEDDNNDDDTA